MYLRVYEYVHTALFCSLFARFATPLVFLLFSSSFFTGLEIGIVNVVCVASPLCSGDLCTQYVWIVLMDPCSPPCDVRFVALLHPYTVCVKIMQQEYSKQIGKLDEGWAKSLSHACQLCQGQTCTLCGDKCLKLEPPVIICQHCNKRVVRGGKPDAFVSMFRLI